MELEEKTFPFEIKALTEEGQFEGYAAIFGGKPDTFNEIIEKGAFTKTLQEQTQFPVLWYHDPRNPVGIADASVDSKGLKILGQLNLSVQLAQEKYALMKQRVIKGLSIGFRTITDTWKERIRYIKEIKLYEISLATFQMHPKALISNVKQLIWDEQKPFPHEHSARIKDPGLFDADTFRRKKDGTIYGSIKVPGTAAVLWGKLKEHNKPKDNPIPQSLRFPTENWTVTQAKAWLKDNNVKHIKFEAATKSLEGVIEFITEFKAGKVISSANLKLINNALEALSILLTAAEPLKDTQDEGGKSLFNSVIEGLEMEDKPHLHLFGSTVKILENLKQE